MVGCSPDRAPVRASELADAQAQADEATAVDFSGRSLNACGLLAREEVASAIGPLAGEPVAPAEDAADTAEGRCVWHGSDGRALSVAASEEGGAERLAAIPPGAVPAVSGSWEQARLQGCCLLHAVKDDAMVSLDFSAAGLELAQAAGLAERALARVHEPLDSP